jgi:protein-S-isoprenylcysteine O-methyltransferase Ste14
MVRAESAPARAFRLGGAAASGAALVVFARWWQASGALRPVTGAAAAGTDALLFSLFALHHSVLARPFAKAWLSRVVPPPLLRSTYVWTASVLLAVTALAWQPVGGVVWEAGTLARALLGGTQAAGLATLLLSARRISVRELAGLDNGLDRAGVVESGGPYRLVRHPIYLGVLLLLGAATPMTGDRVLFVALTLLYVVIAMPYEEAGLAAQLGPDYDAYRARVRWRLIPYVH